LIEAHTDGDAYVYFRDDNVIAVGDAIAPERDIELDWYGGGWLGGRVDSLKQLLALTNAKTRFVPSYGGAPVESPAVQHDTCALPSTGSSSASKGRDQRTCQPASWKARPDVERPAKFVYAAHKGLGPQQIPCPTTSYETPDARLLAVPLAATAAAKVRSRI
jgi:glyoxylase-like metal-dependent hydrolase (beta-lactamase superfamily II)